MTTLTPLTPPTLDPHTMALIRMAVREDMGHATYGTVQGDKTVDLAIPQELRGTAHLVARKPGVLAGTFLLPPILREYAVDLECTIHTPDGTRLAGTETIATLTGPVRALLSAERVILNFLGHLSGIASLTRVYVDTVANAVPDPAKRPAICDTRKTTPAYRALDKYAVRAGGGVNHRLGLHDGVMLKDNHLAALRDRLDGGGKDLTLAQLTSQIRVTLDPQITLWLEVDTLEQLEEALDADIPGADIILLDNFTPSQMKQAVLLRDSAQSKIQNSKSKTLLEASGGITLHNLPDIAQTGVDRISIGALTHSAPVLDLSMEFQ
jgi:nicotinate-nucleotide pyrophosphorylase (carboxylating)